MRGRGGGDRERTFALVKIKAAADTERRAREAVVTERGGAEGRAKVVTVEKGRAGAVEEGRAGAVEVCERGR